jgi:hypothetical protein
MHFMTANRGIAINLVSADHPRKVLYAVLMSATSNCKPSVQKFYVVPKVMRRVI